jgi:glycosyltransferase involved in cell wall biosynthesis
MEERRQTNGAIRVCMLIPKMKIGGAEMQLLYLTRALDRSRFRVSLCSLIPGDAGMEREIARHVESFHCIRFRWRRFPVSFFRLVSYLKRGRFDILHCHLSFADSLGRIAGWFAGVPVLMTTEHGKHLWKKPPHLLLERILGRVTAARICVSRDIMEIRAKREGTHWQKLKYIPNAVDQSRFARSGKGRAAVLAEFGWPPDDPLVVSIGRLVTAKHYPLLVEVIGLVRERFPGVRCLIVGEGRCRGEIMERIRALGLAEHVLLPGARADIAELLAAADVFVLSSIREGLPVALLEAMAAGTAVAATSVGGIGEVVVDGESGLLVAPDDAAALAGAIGRVLGNIELRRRLGANAARVVRERFSIEKTAEQTGALYTALVRDAAGGGP